jgi:transposase InsO family protein
LALVAGYRAPFEPPREAPPEPHLQTSRPGELVGIDCFFVGRLKDSPGPVWQITAIDTYSSCAWADLVTTGPKGPSIHHTSGLARCVAAELAQAGTCHSQIRSGRPQTNGHVERLHRTILEECWRLAFARYLYLRFNGLRRDLTAYLDDYNHYREHHGRITAGRRPAELVYGAHKMEPK